MIITKIADLEIALQLIQKSPKLAYDTETTELNPRKGSIIGFGLSNGTESVYITHLTWNGTELEEVLSKNDCKLILESLLANSTKLICHNASFDLRFTANYFNINLVPILWSDSMLAKHTSDESFPFGLKDLAANLFGDDVKAEQLEMKASIKANGGSTNQFFKADLAIMAKYCMKDCELTFKINDYYVRELENQGLTKFYFEDEVMPLAKHVTIPMETAGIPVDVPLLQKTKTELDAAILYIEAQVQGLMAPHSALFQDWFMNKDYPPMQSGEFAQTLADIQNIQLPLTDSGRRSMAAKHLEALPASSVFKQFMTSGAPLSAPLIKQVQLRMNGGPAKVNLSSKHHLKKIFFDTLNEEPLSRTPTGLPQVDDDFLESIKSKYDFVPLLQDYNRLIKIQGTYIDSMLEEQEDGILYPSFQQHRTVSGRYGSNIQQLPRKLDIGQASDIVRKYNNMIRDFLISAPDSVLIGADYESLEPKVFAHMSGDEGLKDIFRQNKDFYSEISIKTEGLKGVSSFKDAPNYLGKVNKAARQKAKSYCLGVPYGLTGYKLQFELNIDQKLADKLVADYLAAFPQLANFMESSKHEAKTKGFVRSEAGRIRHLGRAKTLYNMHGDGLLDSLALWKEHHEFAGKYRHMKELRKEYSNLLNNSINFKIQSLAASIVNRACIKINQLLSEKGLKATIVLQAHDEILIHCPLAEATEVCYIMKTTLEDNYKISVPLKADPQIGVRYGDTK